MFGETVDPVNPVDDDGSETSTLDLNIGPLSITADQASTDCSQSSLNLSPVTQTCTASLENLIFSLEPLTQGVGGLVIVSADLLVVQSISTNDGSGASSENTLTEIVNLCILQAAGGPCTQVTEPGLYTINIAGVAQGTITVAAQDTTTAAGGAPGSGLTVTILKIDLTTPSGDIDLDLGKARTFVSDQAVTATPSPAPALEPPPAPTATPAQLPVSGGPTAGGDSSYGWYFVGAAMATFAAIVLFFLALPPGTLASGRKADEKPRHSKDKDR